MTVIHVPKPRNAMNKDRSVSSLLQAQIQHLHAAERNLPLRYHSRTYINAIKTEGEAAVYIRGCGAPTYHYVVYDGKKYYLCAAHLATSGLLNMDGEGLDTIEESIKR